MKKDFLTSKDLLIILFIIIGLVVCFIFNSYISWYKEIEKTKQMEIQYYYNQNNIGEFKSEGDK